VTPEYGAGRRRLHVIKMRGTQYQGGYHDFSIRRGGMRAYPRLVAAGRHRAFPDETVPSTVAALDQLLGGGLDRGTSTLVIGPSGVGKSTLALSYLMAGLERGEPALILSFDETVGILLRRAAGVGMDLTPHVQAGASRSSRSIRPTSRRGISVPASVTPSRRTAAGSSWSTASRAT